MEFRPVNQKPRIIRALLILLFMALPVLQAAAAGLTLSLPATTLDKAIKKIQSKTDYQFFYSDKLAGIEINAVEITDGTISASRQDDSQASPVLTRSRTRSFTCRNRTIQTRPMTPSPQLLQVLRG